MRVLKGFALLMIWTASAGTAVAQEEPLWELGLGFAGLSMPNYRGSNERTGHLLPFPYIIYNGERFKVDRDGVRGSLFQSNRITLDISAAASTPAKSGEGARAGMPDLHPAFEFGPALRVDLNADPNTVGGWTLVVPARVVIATDFGHTQSLGMVFAPYVEYSRYYPTSGWDLSASFGPMYAGERYHDYYYEVPSSFATAERPAYDASSGYSGSRVTLAASRRSKNYWIGAFVRYDTLSGAAFEGSPLVRQDHSLMVGIGVARVLARSREVVPMD